MKSSVKTSKQTSCDMKCIEEVAMDPMDIKKEVEDEILDSSIVKEEFCIDEYANDAVKKIGDPLSIKQEVKCEFIEVEQIKIEELEKLSEDETARTHDEQQGSRDVVPEVYTMEVGSELVYVNFCDEEENSMEEWLDETIDYRQLPPEIPTIHPGRTPAAAAANVARLTAKIEKLKKRNDEMRKKNNCLRSKLARRDHQISKLTASRNKPRTCEPPFFESMTGALRVIVERSLEKNLKHICSEQCDEDMKLFAIKLYLISPKAYRFLRSELDNVLPCERSVERWKAQKSQAEKADV